MATTVSMYRTFPIVRLLSGRLTPYLLRLPLTPNEVTFLSLVFGLAAAMAFAQFDGYYAVGGAILLMVSYVLDNCDGEIARQKNLTSRFGARFDDFADWLVHSLLFLAIGIAQSHADGEDAWLWMGIAAAAGGTINYTLGLMSDFRQTAPAPGSAPDASVDHANPTSAIEWCAYIFRELFRADFCFIILVFAVAGALRWLLIAASIGAQAYWMLRAVRAATRFHV